MNDVVVAGENLVSTTRASDLSGYSKDYIGQLCRGGKISCRQISGQWCIDLESLTKYQKGEVKSDSVSSINKGASLSDSVHSVKVGNVRDDTFTYDGIEYVSTNRGADLTGYAQDYVGQLARGSEVAARKVGRRWFVSKQALLQHKKHNDAQLRAVQAQSVGLTQSADGGKQSESLDDASGAGDIIPVRKGEVLKERPRLNFNVRYVTESHESLPIVRKSDAEGSEIATKVDPAIMKDTHEDESQLLQGDPHTLDVLQEHSVISDRPQKAFVTAPRQDDIVLPRCRVATEASVKGVSEDAKRSYAGFIWVFVFLLVLGAGGWFGYKFWISDADLGALQTIQLKLQDQYGELVPGKNFKYNN